MTGIIILAAGESSRLGQPKQLVEWRGKPLIVHAALVAISAGLGPVAVVLGAADAPCRQALTGLDLHLVHHPGWAEGMGGSIAAGMRTLGPYDLDSVIVMLCDQPHVAPADLNRLIAERLQSGCEIVASSYGETSGPPVLFSKNRFDKLLALTGPNGAKQVFHNGPSLTVVPCPAAEFDIDTPADLALLQQPPVRIPS